jgi:hypothetical protein
MKIGIIRNIRRSVNSSYDKDGLQEPRIYSPRLWGIGHQLGNICIVF